MSSQILLNLVIIPLIWSALLSVILHFNRGDAALPDDATEKWQLTISLAPVGLGLMLIILSWLTPTAIPDLSLPTALIPQAPPVATAHVTHVTQRPFDFKELLAWLTTAGLVIYALKAAYGCVSLILSFERLRRIIAEATPCEIAGYQVRITDAPVPPMAWGRKTVVLPAHLIAHFDEAHLTLIIQHERAHLRRADSLYFAMLSWIEALFWYNPFLRQQTQRCRMAAELACDADVLNAAPAMREVYARTLVQTLKHTAGDIRQYAPAVFSHLKSGDYRMRIREIMHANSGPRKPTRKWVYGLLALATLPFAYAQVACSQSQQIPTASWGASDKTPVYASSDGTVEMVSDPIPSASNDGQSFQAIQVDNGDGIKTTYTTRGGTTLKVGDKLSKGQLVSSIGSLQQTSVSLINTTVGTVKGIKCLTDTIHSCNYGIEADSVSGFKDSPQFIATGNVKLLIKGRAIYADTIFSDPKAELATAQGHIRIE